MAIAANNYGSRPISFHVHVLTHHLYLICTKLMPPESQLHTTEFLEEYSLVGNRALLPFRSECADRWRLEIDTPFA